MMRTRLHRLPACVVAFVLLTAFGLPSTGGVPHHTWQERVDELARPLIDGEKAVGLVVGLVAPDGHRESYGYGKTKEDGPRPTATTLFEIGSVTKTFTALLLASMVEEGEVQLDDPVRPYLPAELVVPRRGEREITLLELATHTSGLPENPPSLLQAIIKNPKLNDNPFADFDRTRLRDELALAKVKDEPKPKVAYSNLGMGLLGDALAHRAGGSYSDLIRDRITAPLGMNDTLIGVGRTRADDMATGHGPEQRPVPCWDFPTIAGCGAICSNVNDLLTYVEAQSGRKKTPLAAAMRSTQERRETAFVVMSVGLGWFMQKIAGHQVWWHNGGTGGYSSFVAFCRDPAVAVVVLCNTGPEGVGPGEPIDTLGRKLLKQLIVEANLE